MDGSSVRGADISARQGVDRIRGLTAVVMGFAGIQYLRNIYMQQMYLQGPLPRGFRNPAFRWLSAFFSSAITQQAVVNVFFNPELMRLWSRATLQVQNDEEVANK